MFDWLSANLVSIVLVFVLLAAVSLIIRRLVLDKRAGRLVCGGSCGSCGGSCAGCPMHGQCHK